VPPLGFDRWNLDSEDGGFLEFSVDLLENVGHLPDRSVMFTAFEEIGHNVLFFPRRFFKIS
jgi:hypothetical protein